MYWLQVEAMEHTGYCPKTERETSFVHIPLGSGRRDRISGVPLESELPSYSAVSFWLRSWRESEYVVRLNQ